MPTGTVTRVIARPGYGVVAIDTHYGLKHIKGMMLHFMRMTGNEVVPADAYDSPVIERVVPPVLTIGDSRPIVGLFGEAGANVDKLGVIMRRNFIATTNKSSQLDHSQEVP